MNLKIRKAPANTPLTPQSTVDPKVQKKREKAKIQVVDYDAARYLVGIKSGVKWVSKLYVLKQVGKRRIRAKTVEKEIKKRILAGDFDVDLGIKRKRGRKPGSKVRRKTGKRLERPAKRDKK